MFNVGQVVATFKADVSNFQKGVSSVKNSLSGLKSTFSSFGSGVANVMGSLGHGIVNTIGSAINQAKTLVLVGTGLMVAGVLKLGKTALESAKDFEQAEIAYTTLFKSADKARETLKNIQEDAKKTPFNLKDLVLANQLLISAGESAEGSREVIKNLGNAISATGGGTAELNRLAVNLQQIKALGKATALDIRQFAFAGINIYSMLAETTGKTVEEVREMDISYELLTESLAKASAEGGRFEGAMQNQSKSLQGLLSNMQDVISLTLKDIIVQSGLFDVVKKITEAFTGFVTKVAPIVIDKFKQISKVISGFIEMVKTDDMMNFQDAMLSFGVPQWVIDAFGKLSGALRDMGNWIVENKDTVLTFLKGLAIALGALLIIATITMLVNALTNPIFLVVMAIGLLYTAWQKNLFGIRDITQQVVTKIMEFWNKYKDDFAYIWNGIVAFAKWVGAELQKWWALYGENVIGIIKGVWKIVSGIFEFGFKFIINAVKLFVAIFSGDWGKAWEAVKAISQAGKDFLKDIFGGLAGIVGNALEAVFKSMVDWFNKMWNKAKEMADKIRKSISDAFNVNKRNSPSIADRIQEIVTTANKGLTQVQIPTFSHSIAGSFADVMPEVASTTSNRTVNQYITANISDKVDIDSLNARLAFNARNL